MVLAFGSLIVAAVITQSLVALSSARENTAELLRDKAEVTLNGIVGRVHATLRPVAAQGRAMARMAHSAPSIDDPMTDAFAFGTLGATPQVHSLSLLSPEGDAKHFVRGASGIEVILQLADERTRASVIRAQTVGHAHWHKPETHDGQIILAHLSPAYHPDGSFLGALVQNVSAAALSRAVVRVASRDQRETPFILIGHEKVLAHPLLIAGNLNLSNPQAGLPLISGLGDAILESIWGKDQLRVVRLKPTQGDTIKGRTLGDRVYLFVFRSIDGYGEEPWVVGAYLDGSSTRVQIRRIAGSAMAGGLVLLIAVAAAAFIGRRAARPAKLLAKAARRVQAGELDDIQPLPKTRLRELNEASISFNEMVEGLRERNLIRDLFGKFVPERVATAMLRSPAGLAPQSTEATILFVDIAGFTALVERVDPTATVAILNAYFSALVEVIEAHEGVVTQFQGDAILAVYNVPALVPEHAALAVSTARRIMETVSTQTFRGEKLNCRIGIATGPVIAGNVGAIGRMNYTVHGDAVNLATRLEQLNKTHGTDVLIAASTVACITDETFRYVDTVEVRGQSRQVKVYGV
jgi:adenylate cyclase